MDFKSTAVTVDAILGNVALTLQAFDQSFSPIATITLQFRSTINPAETVQAFTERAETEARTALQAAGSFSKSAR